MPVAPVERFVSRHIGPSEGEVSDMLGVVGEKSLDALIDATVPEHLRYRGAFPEIPPALAEREALAALLEYYRATVE